MKLGLCEASVAQFKCVGIENIKNYVIEIFHEIDISNLPEDFITQYGTTSSDVPFPYYRIPYGAFVIDECGRQADMNTRNVVAYSSVVKDKFPLSNVEKLKQEAYTKTNLDYKVDVLPFIFSSLTELNIDELLYTTQPIEFTGTETNLCMSLRKNYYKGACWEDDIFIYNDIIYYTPRITYKVLKVYAADSYFNSLIRINKEFVDNIEEIIERISDNYLMYVRTSPGEKAIRKVFNGLVRVYESPTDTNLITYKEVSDIPSILYPYNNNGINTIYPYFEILLPEHVEMIYSTESGEYGTEGEWTLLNSASLEQIVFDESLLDCTLSFPRTKEKNGYLLKEEIDHYQILESWLELNGLFARNNRYGTVDLFQIRGALGLYPSETLYPDEEMYPSEPNAGYLTQTHYKSVWYDDEKTKPYGRIEATYTNEDGEKIYSYYPIVDDDTYNDDDYQTYSLSDNYLMQTCQFTEEEITIILETLADNIKRVQYMPADIELKGFPWIESGDGIVIITKDSAVETLILNRTLTGIQSLSDNYVSK